MTEEEIDIHGEDVKLEIPLWQKLLQGSIALILLVAILNIYGFGDVFRYKKTSETVYQPELPAVEMATDAGELVVPLNIIIIRSDGTLGSERDEENVKNLIAQADRIWEQANITLEVRGITTYHQDDTSVRVFYDNINNYINVYAQDDFERGMINLFLLKNLQGINGISFGGLSAIAVADYTSVPDFRALAHEIGHQLGLIHVPEERGHLMYQGANGTGLSLDEIVSSRSIASERFR
ncbi:MAG: hypothetical protein O2794_00715 [bacterium]|nr:hypothetical protein [bacterium]